jgi:hypothetical protein
MRYFIATGETAHLHKRFDIAFKSETYPSRKRIEEGVCIDGITMINIIELNEIDYADYIEGSEKS